MIVTPTEIVCWYRFSLVGDGDGDAVVIADGGAHGRNALYQADHH